EVTDPEILRLCAELCEYGKHLSERFRSPGIPPFEDQYVAYGHYVQALLGNSVDEHLEYFRKQVAESDPEVAGDAPGRTLVRLLISLGRPKEALNAVVDHVFEDAPYGVPVPSALQLCYRAGEYARLRELARERGDLLSYAAGGILNSKAKQEARSA
ncbi:MAG TPA: hypothetical protein VHB50_15850, partial [Bryobacteraceae bacterium]|nr:hypothetical protein [Bryobacteraceae bacterium]